MMLVSQGLRIRPRWLELVYSAFSWATLDLMRQVTLSTFSVRLHALQVLTAKDRSFRWVRYQSVIAAPVYARLQNSTIRL
jgi:hypothetical protein